jgi:hypothetical protein
VLGATLDRRLAPWAAGLVGVACAAMTLALLRLA